MLSERIQQITEDKSFWIRAKKQELAKAALEPHPCRLFAGGAPALPRTQLFVNLPDHIVRLKSPEQAVKRTTRSNTQYASLIVFRKPFCGLN